MACGGPPNTEVAALPKVEPDAALLLVFAVTPNADGCPAKAEKPPAPLPPPPLNAEGVLLLAPPKEDPAPLPNAEGVLVLPNADGAAAAPPPNAEAPFPANAPNPFPLPNAPLAGFTIDVSGVVVDVKPD